MAPMMQSNQKGVASLIASGVNFDWDGTKPDSTTSAVQPEAVVVRILDDSRNQDCDDQDVVMQFVDQEMRRTCPGGDGYRERIQCISQVLDTIDAASRNLLAPSINCLAVRTKVQLVKAGGRLDALCFPQPFSFAQLLR